MSGYKTYFVSNEDKGKLFKNPIPVEVYACKDCGLVIEMKLKIK